MESLGLGSASRDDIVEFLKEGYEILSKYGPLIETYILDFFAENVWSEVPTDWQGYLESLDLPEMTSLIDCHLPLKGEPPESLKQLRFLINKYSLSRELDKHSVKINSLYVTHLYEEIKNTKSHFSKSIFKHVKYKKQHEIMIMSEVVCKAAHENDVQFVIDIGSGKGHLARVLSMCYRLKVIAIEQNAKFTHEAEKLDNEVLNAVVSDGGSRQETFMPKHVTKSIEYNITLDDFEDFIENIYFEHCQNIVHNFSYGIIGLHPCGNLGPTLLRIYKHSQRCKFINLVSCCYNKLNTKYEPNLDFPDVIGYPLSPTTIELDFKLSYSLRELACHAVEKYSQKLLSGKYEDFTVHAYRAVLEKLIMRKYPERRHGRINNVKFKAGMCFEDYQEKALKNSGIDFDRHDLTHEDTLDMLQKWKQVVIYYCLRLMFAPLIETQILLDRHLFVDHYGDTENMEEDDVTVRVAVRIRPQIPREIIDMCQICTTVTPGEPQVMLGSDKVFTYDYVFNTEDDQMLVYDTCVAPLIDSSLEGYNATILAYGQTGSGKTYTMGSGFDVEVTQGQIGIIPRAIEHLFGGIEHRIQKAQETDTLVPEFKVMAQFMELYNEEVIDLFNPVYNKDKSYKIHEDPYGGIQVKGVTLKTVTSTQEALQCLRVGALSRTTASTQMNTQSSRSHAIFTLHIKQQRLVPSEEGDANEFETLTAKFHFVDLAGSERLKRTGATGDRAKEGISINCGLLALGNVISALGDKSKKALHIPYRDSKLTRLLQDSLGGNSQTVMIACVSPSDRDFMETLNTLKYANRARNIKNKLTINQDKSSRTITQLRQQIAQLQLELIEYKQGKRIISTDGTETVNDMFYENNMLQGEVNNLRTRVKAMQETIDALTLKNTNLLAEKAVGNWIGSGTDNHVTDMVQAYIKEIEELQAKLIEANNTCEQLRKQISRNQHASFHNNLTSMDLSLGEVPSLIEEAKRELQKEIQQLNRTRRLSEMENDSTDNSEYESDSEEKDSQIDLKDELLSLTNDIDMKQKLIDELELSQRRMQTMRQHYEDKLMQLQMRIKNTQEERDKVLHSYSAHPEPSEKVKKVKEEYTKKLSDMQKEMKRLQAAQKEHARLLRNQSQQENQLKSFKNELTDMKRAKVKLINKMKEESQRHKESEMRRVKEIAQLRKETRKNASVIKAMENERRVKDQVLKRKQEEVSNLRKSQRSRLSVKASGRILTRPFTQRHAKQKWLKVEKSINNITISKRGIVEQEVRMEHFLQKREALGKELEVLQERRRQAFERNQDTSQLDSYIEDIEENINYVQETISETQHNVMQIEETQDNNEAADIQQIVDSVFDIDEAKYLLQKLFSMTLSQSHMVAQREAKLKENETVLAELQQENTVKGQLLDHVLHSEHPIFAKDLTTSVSSNANDTTSSTYSSRSGSPIDTQYAISNSFTEHTINDRFSRFNSMEVIHNNNNHSKSKIRRRTAKTEELLFGTADI